MGAHGTQRDETQPIKGRRPLSLTIMLLVYLLWIILGWLRFAAALQEQELILGLVSPGVQYYLIAAGLTWGLSGLPVLWGLITRAGWTPKLIQITAILYPGMYWFERLFLWQDPEAARNWPFMLLLTILWLSLVFIALSLQRVQDFFSVKQNQGE
ncbi:MAG: hypothetical protein SVP52_06800 [Chloroflexota bacterium]|nr:hypothetical protein [Chloroflexota bacterium]